MRIFILIILMHGVAFAQDALFGRRAFLSQPAPAGGCSTVAQTNSNFLEGTYVTLGNTYKYIASVFTASNSHTICSIVFSNANYRAIPQGYTVNAAIYTDSSGVPGSLVGTRSSEVANSTLTEATTYGYATYPNMSASLTAGTRYWVVLTISGLLWADTVWFKWVSADNDTTYIKKSNDLSTWVDDTQAGADAQMLWIMYR